MTQPSSQGPCTCPELATEPSCPRHAFMTDWTGGMMHDLKDHLRDLRVREFCYPPVDPVTGEVSAGDDAILMGERRHCDVPPPHRRDDCTTLMKHHRWIDVGAKGITVCP